MKLINFQKPIETIELLSTFIEKKSNMLQGNEWFGAYSKKENKKFIKKYFTICWQDFLNYKYLF